MKLSVSCSPILKITRPHVCSAYFKGSGFEAHTCKALAKPTLAHRFVVHEAWSRSGVSWIQLALQRIINVNLCFQHSLQTGVTAFIAVFPHGHGKWREFNERRPPSSPFSWVEASCLRITTNIRSRGYDTADAPQCWDANKIHNTPSTESENALPCRQKYLHHWLCNCICTTCTNTALTYLIMNSKPSQCPASMWYYEPVIERIYGGNLTHKTSETVRRARRRTRCQPGRLPSRQYAVKEVWINTCTGISAQLVITSSHLRFRSPA